jgi:hypothetical protein
MFIEIEPPNQSTTVKQLNEKWNEVIKWIFAPHLTGFKNLSGLH